MQIGMIGLGRMGANMTQRLMKAGHQCIVYDAHPAVVAVLAAHGAVGVDSPSGLVAALEPPRSLWLMVPAAVVDDVLNTLTPLLAAGDIVVDGGNSLYHDDIRRSAALRPQGIHYVDVGTSGGVAGLERGYCLMVGGEAETVRHLDPILTALAPGAGSASRTPGRNGPSAPAEQGYLYCGNAGAGHFVKMVHNGIEYGIMAAYAEGFNILNNANAGKRARSIDAETAPLRHPEHYQYELNLPDIAEVWRRGSVIGSWLLDLVAAALHANPELTNYAGRVADSGEGRWTLAAAIDTAVPAPILSAAIFERFSSRGDADFADKVLSAMRYQFGGHIEQAEREK